MSNHQQQQKMKNSSVQNSSDMKLNFQEQSLNLNQKPEEIEGVKKKAEMQSQDCEVSNPAILQKKSRFEEFMQSPYLQTYLENFKDFSKPIDVQEYLRQFASDQIVYRHQICGSMQFGWKRLLQSKNEKLIYFEVHFSYFQFVINVLNLTPDDHISLQFQKLISRGTFGSVYEIEFENKKIAVKEIPYKNGQEQIINVIREYSIMKLCSSLKLAPVLPKVYGFDILITETSIYFCVQKGYSLFEYQKALDSKWRFDMKIEELKQSLSLLHKLNITHNDIKPENIIFSPSLNRLVFIDFGLSQSHKQPVGYMKMETAKGSLHYCCDDMKKLMLAKNVKGYVDMYYNDIWAFSKTIQQCGKNKEEYVSRNIQIQSPKIQSPILIDSPNFGGSGSDKKIQNSEKKIKYEIHEQAYLISFLWLISSKMFQKFKCLIEEKPEILNIINKNFSKVFFIFIQMNLDLSLYGMYNLLLEEFQINKISLQFETKRLINSILTPYFKKIKQKNISDSPFVQKYLNQLQNNRINIQKRFKKKETQKTHPAQNQNASHLTQNQILINLQCLNNNQQDQVTFFSNLIVQKLSYRSITQIAQEIRIRFNEGPRKQEPVNQKISFFVHLFKRKNLSIKFQINNKQISSQDQVNSFKIFVIILKMLYLLFINCLQNYQLGKMIGYEVYKIFVQKQANHDGFKLLKFILYQLQNLNQKLLKKKNYQETSKKQFIVEGSLLLTEKQYIQKYFENYTLDYYFYLHSLIQVLHTFNTIGCNSLQYEQNCIFHQKYVKIISLILGKCIAIRKILSQHCQNLYHQLLQVHNAVETFIFKCLQCRLFSLVIMHSRAQIQGDLYRVTMCYLKIFHLAQFLDENENFNFINDRQTLRWLQRKNIYHLVQNDRVYKIQEQFFELIIYSYLIPEELSSKYNILEQYNEMFAKILKEKQLLREYHKMSIFIITKALKIYVYQNKFKQILNLAKQLELEKSILVQQRYNMFYFLFFNKVHYSKYSKKFERNEQIYSKNPESIFSDGKFFKDKLYKQSELNLKNDLTSKELQNQKIWPNQHFDVIKSQPHPAPQKLHDREDVLNKYNQIWERGQKFSLSKPFTVNTAEFLDVISFVFQFQTDNQLLFKQYLRKYEQDIIKYEEKVKNMINFFRSHKLFKMKVPEFFRWKNKNILEFWEILQKQNLLILKMNLVQELILMFENNQNCATQKNFQVILNEWQKVEDFVNIAYLKHQEKILPIFFMMKCKKCALHFSQYFKWNLQQLKVKIMYEESISQFFQSIKKSYTCNPIQNGQVQDFMDYLCKQNMIELVTKIIIDFDEKRINIPLQFFRLFSMKITSKGKNFGKACLKQLFYKISDRNQIHRFFYLDVNMTKWFYFLIQIGIEELLKESKEQRTIVIKEKQINQYYFLNYLFFVLYKFVNEHPSSSYSYITLHFIKYFSSIFKKSLANSQMQIKDQQPSESIQINQKKNKLNTENISLFQFNSLERLIVETYNIFAKALNVKITQLNIFILQVESIRWLNLVKSIKFQETHSILFNIEKQLQKLTSRLYQMSKEIHKLQFINRLFFINSYLYLYIQIRSFRKLITKSYQCDSENHIEKYLGLRKQRYFEINLFRTCRKVEEYYFSSIKLKQQQMQYFQNFIEFKQSYFENLIVKPLQLKNPQKYYCIFKNLRFKLQKYLKNVG